MIDIFLSCPCSTDLQATDNLINIGRSAIKQHCHILKQILVTSNDHIWPTKYHSVLCSAASGRKKKRRKNGQCHISSYSYHQKKRDETYVFVILDPGIFEGSFVVTPVRQRSIRPCSAVRGLSIRFSNFCMKLGTITAEEWRGTRLKFPMKHW